MERQPDLIPPQFGQVKPSPLTAEERAKLPDVLPGQLPLLPEEEGS